MRKNSAVLIALVLLVLLHGHVLADKKDDTINTYSGDLQSFGVPESSADNKAEKDVDALINTMESDQYDMQIAYDNINTQVSSLAKSSTRKKQADARLKTAKDKTYDFTEFDADKSIQVHNPGSGSPPYVTADEGFAKAQKDASEAVSRVRRTLIAPDQPGNVPTGDIVTDFIPQIIRQLFRFTSVVILIAFTVSGVMFIIAHGNEEMLTKAKAMLYFTLIGFAFVSLAFAIVKGVTSIDFFGFI